MSKQSNSLKNKYWFGGLCMLCAALMLLSFFAEQVGGPFKIVASFTVIPMQQGVNQVGIWLHEFSDNFKTMKSVQAENEKLQEELDMLMAENSALQQEKYELERLRELYKLDMNYAEYEKIGAHVIGCDSGNWFSMFTIDKGSLDGVRVDMNVIAGNGLVGIVTETGPTWATVRSVIDDSSNVSAMVLSTSDRCIVNGDLTLINDGKLSFEQMENNDNTIVIGDQVVTSHISDKYLQGILIGYVREVSVDSNNLTRSGYITPAVDFKNLQEVLVITETKEDVKNKTNADSEVN
jgi:rod shape-determining protein MreC